MGNQEIRILPRFFFSEVECARTGQFGGKKRGANSDENQPAMVGGTVETGGPLHSIRRDRPRVVESPANGSLSARVSDPAFHSARVVSPTLSSPDLSLRPLVRLGHSSAGYVNLGNLLGCLRCQARTCFKCQAHACFKCQADSCSLGSGI